MADTVLSDGREIVIDLTRVSMLEYRALFETTQPQADEDATIAKAAGLTVEEYVGLSVPDFRRVGLAFFRKAKEPLADPN